MNHRVGARQSMLRRSGGRDPQRLDARQLAGIATVLRGIVYDDPRQAHPRIALHQSDAGLPDVPGSPDGHRELLTLNHPSFRSDHPRTR